jgi:hypothetical protein
MNLANKRKREEQLTLDLFLLRLEGRACGLSRLLQVMDHGILLLAGLTQIFVGHTQLGQLPVEPHDLLAPELDGRLRLLKRGVLPLELALCFLLGRAFKLKGGLGPLLGGLLLLPRAETLLPGARSTPARATPPPRQER